MRTESMVRCEEKCEEEDNKFYEIKAVEGLVTEQERGDHVENNWEEQKKAPNFRCEVWIGFCEKATNNK